MAVRLRQCVKCLHGRYVIGMVSSGLLCAFPVILNFDVYLLPVIGVIAAAI